MLPFIQITRHFAQIVLRRGHFPQCCLRKKAKIRQINITVSTPVLITSLDHISANGALNNMNNIYCRFHI